MSDLLGEVGAKTSVSAVYHMHYTDRHGNDCVEDIDLGLIADDSLSPKQIERRLKLIYLRHPRFARRQKELAREIQAQSVGG